MEKEIDLIEIETEEEVDPQLIDSLNLTFKILKMVDGLPSIEILFALMNVIVTIHKETGIDVKLTLNGIKNMSEKVSKSNEIH